MMRNRSIPVHILTGFLGSGKTTLLNTLLSSHTFADTLVIVNEFGEISIDHHLVKTSTETIFELTNGCLCCATRGELVETLLAMNTTKFKRVIIETTGIADPLPVLQSLTDPELQQMGLHPATLLCVYDNVRGPDLQKAHSECAHQVALADTIFISRTDMKSDITESLEAINRLNPDATIQTSPADIHLDDQLVKHIQLSESNPAPHIHHHRHDTGYSSVVLSSNEARPLSTFTSFLDHLSRSLGPSLLRVKGFGMCTERNLPFLLQMSGPILHEPVPLPHWPDADNKTRLVIIGKHIDHDMVRSLFKGFFDIPDIDTPDLAALTDNPLAISGSS